MLLCLASAAVAGGQRVGDNRKPGRQDVARHGGEHEGGQGSIGCLCGAQREKAEAQCGGQPGDPAGQPARAHG